MVVGLVSIPALLACGIGGLSGILAIVLGIVGLGAANKLPDRRGKGLAVTGIVTGALAVLLAIGFWALVFLTADSTEERFSDVGGQLDDYQGVRQRCGLRQRRRVLRRVERAVRPGLLTSFGSGRPGPGVRADGREGQAVGAPTETRSAECAQPIQSGRRSTSSALRSSGPPRCSHGSIQRASFDASSRLSEASCADV